MVTGVLFICDPMDHLFVSMGDLTRVGRFFFGKKA